MRIRAGRRLVALAALLTLADLAVGQPGVAAPPKPPGRQAQHAVAGHGLKAKARPKDPAAAHPYQPGKVTWPAAGTATASVATTGTARARAGTLPVSAAAPAVKPAGMTAAAAAAAVPSQVKVQVMDRAATAKAGVTGVLMRVSRADGQAAAGPVNLQVDYRGFRDAVGADWASRLHLVQLPECALTNPACGGRTVLLTHNDVKTGTVSADVPATADGTAGTVLAVAATPSGGGGDYKATSLSPSASWQASTQTGDFTWSYPMEIPPAPSGDDGTPDLSLGYSSGGTDGRTSATNNQVSWVGEGFDYWSGYVERRYVGCGDDGVSPKTGDNCWRDDNASLMLNGHATELVKDATTGAWHPKSDDGSKVEKLTGATNGDNDGEYWRVTTADGTQYYFGLNHLPGWASGKKTSNSAWTVPVYGNNSGEPCHGSTYSASWCQQAWRWNLDYVVDTHANAQSFWYTAETNYYARGASTSGAGTSTVYTRGGTLDEIDYGQRSDTLFSTSAPERVTFGTSERCIADASFDCAASKFTTANASHWPDTPVDANCNSGATCTYSSPTFWSRKRLTSITSQVYENSAYSSVDAWTLTQSFPATGDGTSPEMWLSRISRAGKRGGTATVPDVTFAGVQLTGRVDQTEGLPPLTKWRISSVTDETGAQLSVNYSAPECVAGQTPAVDSNTKRCFPGYWSPEGATSPQLDWFHKYVTTQVTSIDGTGGAPPEVTAYTYVDTPAWHHDDDVLTQAKYKTWGQYKGYGQVRVLHGASTDPIRSQADYLYFRGMDGDATASGGVKSVAITDSAGTTLADADALQGMPREEVSYNNGTKTEDVIDDATVINSGTQTRLGVTVNSAYVRNVRSRTTTTLASGASRTVETDTGYDSLGMETQIDQHGDLSTTADDKCTRVSYARNTSANILDAVTRVETVNVACGSTPNRPTDVLSDSRISYDGQAYGAAPTKGDETLTERLVSYNGSTPVYQTVESRQYDTTGRTTVAGDNANHTTKTGYTPTVGGPVTRSTTTDPLGYTSTTVVDPAWGSPLTMTDPNGKVTNLAYDPLGRLTSVWLPGRDKATQSANSTFSYLVRSDGPTAIGTSTLGNDGTYSTSYELYDANLRPRQTQEPAPGGGRIVTDTIFDSRGQEVKANGDYYADGDPSTDLFMPNSDADVPSQTVTTYDAMERPVAEVFRVHGQDKWKTTMAYVGDDRVDVTPPQGATPTTEITDANGLVTERRSYHGSTPTGAYDSTKYSYTAEGALASVTQPSGAVRSYHYDLRGRQTEIDDPDSGKLTQVYDDLDQITSTTDARGNTLAFSYDALGRKTGEYLGSSGSTSGTKLIGWTYDTLAKGYPTSSTRYVNGNAYTDEVTGYDNEYRPTGNKTTIPASEGFLAGSYSYTQDFNVDGTLHRSSFPAAGGLAAETMLYGYDEQSQPTTLHGATEYVSGISYNKLGQVLQETMPANQHQWTRSYSYEDGTNRLSRILDTRDTGPYTLSDRTYSYNDSGNITKVSTAADGVATDTQCYQYDYLQRLTQAWSATDNCAGAPQTSGIGGPAPYWQSFSYDADGNRTGETDHGTSSGVADVIHTYTYPTGAGAAHPHAVQSVTTTGGPDSGKTDTYGYDATGNTTARNLAAGAQVLNWDVEGRLGSATANGLTSSYLYDADGDLLIRHDASGATLYLPDQEVHADNNGTLTGQRYYDCGDSLIALRTNAGLYWMLTDPQGTSTVAVDTSSQAVTRRYYTPFGQTRGTPSSNYPGDRGYVGGTTDSVTGLEHLGARDYDTSLGRFVSVDPVQDTEDVQQLEGYSYANNSPIAGSDPTGLWWGSHLWHKVKHAVTSHVSHWWNSGWSSFSNFWVHTYRAAVKKVKHVAKRVSHAWHSVTHRISHAVHHFVHTVTHYYHVARRAIHHYVHVARRWVTKHVTKPLSHAYKVAKRWTSHAAAVASHAVASGAASAWHATTSAASTVGAGIAVGATATYNWTKKNWRTVAGAAVFGVCVVASAGACFAAGVALAAVKLGADLYDGHSVRDSLKEFAIGVGFSALGYGAAKGLEPFVNGADVGALRPVESRLALAGGGDVGRSAATLGRTTQRAVSGLVTQGNNVINYVNNLYNATFTCGAPSGGPSYCG